MKIVIDIPEYVYEICKGHKDIVYQYIANGTPLHSAEWVNKNEETNLTSEELFALDIEQNVKDIDSGEDDSYYRGRLAGMLSAYRILKGKPYEEKETDGESK